MLSPLSVFLSIVIAASLAICRVHTLPAEIPSVELQKRQNTTLAAPIIATPSEDWEGNDGTWSTFEIRVGTPPKVFRVLPATSWQETWIVWDTVSACKTYLGVKSDCGDERGGLFNNENSTTWQEEGEYALGLNTDLGYEGNASYGYDIVGLGYTNDTGPTLPHSLVAEIISDQWWFGMLGLGFQPTNFSYYGNPEPSFAATLFTNGSISSKSWSYTAGAVYRLKSVFGSLIFGGYDASKFTPNDVVFNMGPDNLRDLLVSVRSITSTSSSGNTTLMSDAEFHFLDSSVPELWLPVDVCQKFETAFGLKMDDTTGLYLLDGPTHEKLKSDNPNITFTLGNFQKDGYTVDIVLPYASFDLNVSAPIVNTTSYYFPIRQAQNDSTYTLGRTFFQEAYVTAEYETRTFNVSQCIFDANAKSTVLAIPSNMPTPTSGGGGSGSGSGGGNGSKSGGGSKKLGGGAIAGIVIGALAALALLGGLLFCCLRGMFCFRRRDKRPPTPVAEVDGTRIEQKHQSSPESTQASAITSEMPGQDAKVEIAGNPIMHPQELEAEVPIMAHRQFNPHDNTGLSDSSGQRNDGSSALISSESSPHSRPAELQAAGRRPTNGPEMRPEDFAEPDTPSEVSPSSPVMQRGRGEMPNIVVSSPVVSNPTLSPRSPVHGSRFEEHWSDHST